MKMKNIAVIFGLLSVAVLLSGMSSCEEIMADPDKAFQDSVDQTPHYVVTIHEVIKYKRAELVEMDVDCFFGGTICVNKNPFIHSRDIQKVEMIPRPGNPDFFDLKLTLTTRGKMLWSALSVARVEKKKLGILIDGMYYREVHPPMLTETDVETVLLEGPFDPANAKGVVTNSERNYKIFNPR